MRRLAARLAVGAAIVASATAVPFFLEQTTPHEFKSAADLATSCAAYRTDTANSLYTGDDTQIAYETVCGKKDPVSIESPGTDRLLCQQFGWFPPTSQIKSVCDLNYLYQKFLQCWGTGGLLTRLVENGRFASVATQTFGALQALVTEHSNVLNFEETSFLACLTTDFDGGPADEALARSLNAKITALLSLLATSAAPPGPASVCTQMDPRGQQCTYGEKIAPAGGPSPCRKMRCCSMGIECARYLDATGLCEAGFIDCGISTSTQPADTSSGLAVVNKFPEFSLVSNPAFMCTGPRLSLNPDIKVEAVTDVIDQQHAHLSLCAARVHTRIESVFGEIPEGVSGVGCYYNSSDGYVPYVVFDQTALSPPPPPSCTSIQATNQFSPLGCVDTSISIDTTVYQYNTDAVFFPEHKTLSANLDHVGIFHCRAPWFPRGALLNHTCGTTYAPATLATPTRKVTTLIQAGSELECVDACTLTPACAGYIWTGDAGSRRHECGLLIDNAMANPGVAIAQLPSRLPLRLSGNSGATVENGTVDLPREYVAKTMTIRQHGEAHGPWLVYGYTTQSQLQQDHAGLSVTRDGPQAPRTPEACGAHCAATATCRFAMWLSSQEPCHYYLTTSPTFSSAVFANPGQCANIGVFRMPDPEYGNSSQMAVCDAAPMCTWHADYGCTDVFRPTTGPYSGVPTTIPVVYAVPDLDVATGATIVTSEGDGWCPGGAVCTSCKEPGCADAETIIFPSTVDVFDDINSGGCPNLRVATIMSPAPQFKNNSFSGCPRLEAIALRNTSCVHPTVPSLGCNAIFEDGAVPSCVGPTPGKFGYALHGVADPAGTACADCAACDLSAGLEGLGVFSVEFMTHVGVEAFRSCNQIQTASFSGGSAGSPLVVNDLAFGSAQHLVGVDFGAAYVALMSGSFRQTTNLATIAGGTNIVSVGPFAFLDSGFSGAFPLSNSLTLLDVNAFSRSSVSVFNTGSSLTKISERAFMQSGIRAVVFGANLEIIDSTAFSQATLLSEVEFQTTKLTTIAASAFSGCSSLEKFVVPLPSTGIRIKVLGASSFAGTNVRTFLFELTTAAAFSEVFGNSGCTGIQNIPNVPYINCEPAIKETCSSSSDGPCATAVSVLADSDVPDYGFSSSSTLLAVEIAATVSSIGESAFYPAFSNYGSIETVTFAPRTAPLTIGESAFMALNKLKRLVLDSGTVVIGADAFTASGIVSADLTAVTTINSGAFDFSVYLAEVKFGAGLETIGENAFLGCTSLLSVVFPTTTTPPPLTIYTDAFSKCTSLARVEFKEDATLKPGVFSGCVGLHTVVFPSSGFTAPTETLKAAFLTSNVCSSDSDCAIDGNSVPSSTQDQIPGPTFLGLGIVPPTHVVSHPASVHSTATIDYADASLNCVPCEPSSTAFYQEGRARVPGEVKHITGNVLAECPTVTEVTVPATTTFDSGDAMQRSSFWSPVLTKLAIQPTPADLGNHHSTVRRCLMNNEGTPNPNFETVQAFDHAGPVDGSVECLPCVTNAYTGDLTIPWYVRVIPPWAFSQCNITGTIRFGQRNGRGIQEIKTGAFDMVDCPWCDLTSTNTIGKVVVPSTITGLLNPVSLIGVKFGTPSFKAAGFQSYLVALSSDYDLALLKDTVVWDEWFVTNKGDGNVDLCPLPPEQTGLTPPSTLSVSLTPNSPDSCAPLAYASPVAYDLLFAVCDCIANKSGCFQMDGANPVRTFTNATATECGPSRGRIGPGILPVYTMFLPINATYETVRTGVGNCEYEIPVVKPHGVEAGGCDFCNADVCVAAALEAVDTAVADATPDASPDGPGTTTGPEMVPTDDDEPMSLVAVIAIMSVGSLSGLVVLWYQFKRRRRTTSS